MRTVRQLALFAAIALPTSVFVVAPPRVAAAPCSCGRDHSGACSWGGKPVAYEALIVEESDGGEFDANSELPAGHYVGDGHNHQHGGVAVGRATSSTGGPTTVSFTPASDRWTRTATDGFNTGQRGDPVTLTWSIVPDGTDISVGPVSGSSSGLIAFFDANLGVAADAETDDVEQKSWFSVVESAYNRWGEVSGLTFVYESADDGAPVGPSPGVLGVRADLRLAGASIDGQGGSNTLALNAFPNVGDGVIDTDNEALFSSRFANFRPLRNVLAHEIGHGIGLPHVVSPNSRQLLEPALSTSFDGPQLIDILAVQSRYGDALERGGGNNSLATATDLGPIALFTAEGIGRDGDVAGPDALVTPNQSDFVSIANLGDTDFFEFTAAEEGLLDLRLAPVGAAFESGPEGGEPSRFDTRQLARLSLALFNAEGQQVATREANAFGQTLDLSDVRVSAGESYFARVGVVDANTQLFRFDAALNLAPNPGIDFDLASIEAGDSGSFSTTADGIRLQLFAIGARGLLSFSDEGVGVVSNDDAAESDPVRVGINGDSPTSEQLLLSFDTTVTLENLQLFGLSTDGTESVELSFLSGENPFEDLTGYDGPYAVGDDRLTFTSPEWQSDGVNFVFGAAGQSPLVIQAGTILSLTSVSATDGGFVLGSITVTAVPEPMGVFLAAMLAVVAWRRRGGGFLDG